MPERGAWILATSAPDFERARQFRLPPASSEMNAGDAVVLYLSDLAAFAGWAEVDAEKRLELRWACPRGDYVELAPLAGFLERKDWPLEGAHPLAKADWDRLSLEIERRAKGKRLPPGTPPTEAERPPRIPRKLRRKPEQAEGGEGP